jgi:hypothetical protein
MLDVFLAPVTMPWHATMQTTKVKDVRAYLRDHIAEETRKR